MNTYIKQSTLTAAIALTIVACGGGGGGGGGISGIGGSGFISSGSVTGFGSVFVNGVEFDTSSSSFQIEDNSGSQNDLIKGMRVKVSGTINADGITGVATSISFEDQLEGPVSSTLSEDADMENKTFTVLGVTVKINAIDTSYSGTDYASLNQGDNIQISGFYDDSGVLQATAVVMKSSFVAGSTIVEAKGTITALSSNTFTLKAGSASISVDASGADLTLLTGGLADGKFVEVKGTISSSGSTSISATRVKSEDNSPADNADVEVEGIITGFDSTTSRFTIEGVSIDASSASLSKTPSNLTLKNGIKVEVEGHVSNGVMQASKVKLREGNIKIEATASNVNSTANSFDMTIAGGQTISVTVNTSTRLEDKFTGNGLTLATLSNVNGQFLRVRGIDDGTNGVIATRIRIESPDDIILQGTIDSQIAGTSVTVQGITIPVDGTTKYRDLNNNPISEADFILAVTNGVSLVKVKDKQAGSGGSNAVGIADEVELQKP